MPSSRQRILGSLIALTAAHHILVWGTHIAAIVAMGDIDDRKSDLRLSMSGVMWKFGEVLSQPFARWTQPADAPVVVHGLMLANSLLWATVALFSVLLVLRLRHRAQRT
jgi:hypothetical protein